MKLELMGFDLGNYEATFEGFGYVIYRAFSPSKDFISKNIKLMPEWITSKKYRLDLIIQLPIVFQKNEIEKNATFINIPNSIYKIKIFVEDLSSFGKNLFEHELILNDFYLQAINKGY